MGELATLIKWEPFRKIVGEIYTNTPDQGGRPNIDVVLMIKLLVLQSMYGLSYPELERQANDKISFLRFLGFPEKVPDHTTVWYFQERLFGFYVINGCSVLEFHEHSKKEDVCEFLQSIRKMNPDVDLVIILDNFRSHHAIKTQEYAEENRTDLVFLPLYSPDLNPIEFIWKSTKRIISRTFIRDLDHLKQIILDAFKK